LQTLPAAIGSLTRVTWLTANDNLGLRGNRLTSLPASLMHRPLEFLQVEENRLCTVEAGLSAWLDTLDSGWKDHQDVLNLLSQATRQFAEASTCPGCGRPGHDADARHCKHCGTNLRGV
jgi:hypothetical protein